jgi:hypothetical protein
MANSDCISRDPSPFASTVRVHRTYCHGNKERTVELEAEYLDPKKANCEDFAEACMIQREAIAAGKVCAEAIRDGSVPGETAVYIIGKEDAEICKICVSNNPQMRLSNLQMAHWDELYIYGLFWGIIYLTPVKRRLVRKMKQSSD